MSPNVRPSEPSSAAVLEQLDAVLLSAAFAGSERLSAFLRYIVARYLAGELDRLKESVIGVEVFGRQPGYDPKVEPIVRIEARRLRTKLDQYYEAAGRRSPVRISVPKGGYLPEFEIRPNLIELRSPEPAATATARSWRPWMVAGVGCVTVGLLAGWLLARHPSGGLPTTRLVIDMPEDQQLDQSGRSVAISPDGSVVAYSALRANRRQLFVRRLDEFTSRPIPGTDGGTWPVFSPDGTRLAFYAAGKVATTTLDGQSLRQVASVPNTFTHMALVWGRDHFLYYTSEPPRRSQVAAAIWRVPDDGSGQPVCLPYAEPPVGEGHYPEQLLPGGNELLVGINRGPDTRFVSARSIENGHDRILLKHAMGGYYLPTGNLIYFWAGNLILKPLDLGLGQETGTGVTLAQGVTRVGHSGAQVGFSQNGSMVYLTGPPYLDRSLVWVDPKGQTTVLNTPPGPWEPLDISRDGKLLLLTKPEDFDQTWSLWTLSLSSGAWRKIANGGSGRTTAVFSADGQRVVFTSDRDGGEWVNLHSIDLAGAYGSERRIIPRINFGQFPQSLSSCGDLTYLEGIHPATNSEIWVLPAGGTPRLFVAGPGWKRHPAFSPDCHWIAYDSSVSGPTKVYVEPYPGPGVPLVAGDGDVVNWAPDGAALYFRSGDRMMRTTLHAGPPLRADPPEKLFEGVFVRSEIWTKNTVLAPDGRFLMVKGKSEYDALRKIHVVLNWEQQWKHSSLNLPAP